MVVIESIAAGEQAGTFSRMEKYLDFPNVIAGQGLAKRAVLQATKFGAEIAIARDEEPITRNGSHAIHLARFAKRMNFMFHSPALTRSMFTHLMNRVEQAQNINVMGETESVEVHGDMHLSQTAP